MRQQDVDVCVLKIFMHEYIYQRHGGGHGIGDAMIVCMEAARAARAALTQLKGEENKEVRKRVLVPRTGTVAQAIELLDLYKEMFPRFTQPEQPLNPVFLKQLTEAASVGMDVWRKRFELVRKSDFLMGKANHFQATLHWLIQPANIVKLESGGFA